MEYTELYYKRLEQLNRDRMQRKALESEGNTVVLAGPGSGKTSVLTIKATNILNRVSEPYGVACITYSREASIVMNKRIISYGVNVKKRLFVGTIHNFCISKILVPFSQIFGLKLPFPLKIATSTVRYETFETAKKLVEGSDNVTETNMNTERRNQVGNLSTIKPPTYDVAMKTAIEYERILHSKGFIDFEDIINYSVQLIQDQEYVRESLFARYPWILIDEYQDLGKPLHEIVLSLLFFTRINIFIVGDPDQSIYSFTGANPKYMNELLKTNKFEKVVLENNYRCPQGIIDASIDVLGQKRVYYSASEDSTEAKMEFYELANGWEDQFKYIAENIIPQIDKEGINREEIAVLIKNHVEIEKCKELLEKYGIECYISKLGFERTPLINWLENCAMWCSDPSNIPFIELFNIWCNNFDQLNRFNPLNSTSIIVFRDILTKANGKRILAEWIDILIKELDILSIVDIDELENLVLFYGIAKSEDFNKYTVDMFSKIGKPINQVVLLTWFAAKGLEFETVILTGMDEGIMPDYNAIKDPDKLQEQCRMCFVGVSRAKKHCILLRSKQYTIYSKKYGKHFTNPYEASRFWDILIEKYGESI